MSDIYLDLHLELQKLFHNLELYGYVFEKTDRLSPSESDDYRSAIKAVFKKTIYYDDDENDIHVNVEVDTNVIDPKKIKEVHNKIKYYYKLENEQKFINKLRQHSELPNVNVPRRVSNQIDDERNVKEELQLLFQTLDLHEYSYDETIRLTKTNVQTLFKKIGIIVKIEFDPLKMDDDLDDVTKNDKNCNYNLENVNTSVDNLLYLAPAARGKRKNQNPKKTKRRKSKSKGKQIKRRQSRRK